MLGAGGWAPMREEGSKVSVSHCFWLLVSCVGVPCAMHEACQACVCPVRGAWWWEDQLSLTLWLCEGVSTGLSPSSQTLSHTTALRIRDGLPHTWHRTPAEQTHTCFPTSPCQRCVMVLNSWFYTCGAVSPSKSPACFPSVGKLLLFMATAHSSLGRVVLLSLQ